MNPVDERILALQQEVATLVEQDRNHHQLVDNLRADVRDLTTVRDSLERQLKGALQELHDVDQAIGKVLGYPAAFPQVSTVDDGSVVTGEHTAGSLADEAARKITELRELLSTEREAAAGVPSAGGLSAEERALVRRVLERLADRSDGVQMVKVSTLRVLLDLAKRLGAE